MTLIAGKNFTQLTNLNILDELRIQGVLVLPGGGQSFTFPSSEYDQSIEDDIIVGDGTFDVNLVSLEDAIKSITIRATTGSTITVVPDGSDSSEVSTVSSGTAVTLIPHSSGWLQI